MTNDSISALFARYGDDVFRLAYSYLGNTADAEDVCQNVFMRLVVKNIALEAGKEKHWLLKCTANACKNHLRSFWHRKRVSLPETIPGLNESESTVHEAVMQLPAKYRVVIHLYYFEEYSQREIAETLGISLTAVQTRMSRAREMLRKELE